MVNDALKKLQNLSGAQTLKRGKDVLYSTNEKGQEVCQHYFEAREQVLVSNLTGGNTKSFCNFLIGAFFAYFIRAV